MQCTVRREVRHDIGVGHRRVLARFRAATSTTNGDAAIRVAQLTARERDVLRLIGRGASNAEIAELLFVSEATVKSHVGHIFAKLEVRDRSSAIVFAFDHGFVTPQAD